MAQCQHHHLSGDWYESWHGDRSTDVLQGCYRPGCGWPRRYHCQQSRFRRCREAYMDFHILRRRLHLPGDVLQQQENGNKTTFPRLHRKSGPSSKPKPSATNPRPKKLEPPLGLLCSEKMKTAISTRSHQGIATSSSAGFLDLVGRLRCRAQTAPALACFVSRWMIRARASVSCPQYCRSARLSVSFFSGDVAGSTNRAHTIPA